MSSTIFQKYNIRRVNKLNLGLLYFFSILISVQAYIKYGWSFASVVVASTFAACLVSTIVFVLNLHSNIIGLTICISPVVCSLILVYLLPGNRTIFLVFCLCTCMSALYFRKNILLIFSIAMNIMLIAFFVVFPEHMLGKGVPQKEFLTYMILIDSMVFVLFFLTKWGNEYVQISINKERQAGELLEKLKITMASIEESTNILNRSIMESNSSINETKEASSNITRAIEEICKGMEEEAHSVTSISNMMGKANKTVVKTRDLSNAIKSSAQQINNIVLEKSNDVEQMYKQMNIIRSAVSSAVTNVVELKASMKHIDSFLSNIEEIAGQTNLLALNASIEAARAGESGRGFSVVAEEIRKLSERSSKAAKDVHEITAGLQQKADSALSNIQKGDFAVDTGTEVVNQVHQGFNSIQSSFESIDSSIDLEDEMIEEIASTFCTIQQQVENLAAISEEYAATIEHITESSEHQNNRIIDLAESINKISDLSNSLKKLLG